MGRALLIQITMGFGPMVPWTGKIALKTALRMHFESWLAQLIRVQYRSRFDRKLAPI